MALNWNAQNVNNWDELKEIEFFDNILEIIVFDLMNCGMSQLTHANYTEFYRRQVFFRLAKNDYKGALEFTEFIPLELLERFIGLSSNAGNKTVTKFNKDVLGELEWITKSIIDRQKTEQKKLTLDKD